GNLVGNKTRRQAGPVQAPRNKTDGNKMSAVMLANRGCQLAGPLASDLLARAILGFQRNKLNEVLASERGREPIISFLIARHGGLVHQVIAEDRRAACASLRDRLPEA